MKIVKGIVVKAIAGRDKGGYFVVKDYADNASYAMIADGKRRKLESPKKKNLRHLMFTGTVIDINDITDRKLKVALRKFYDSVDESEV
ncbi:MAG: KOW domain-containing RNA-binding protein [Oscillospiraceae bacterium]|nr:KOW domain-containing RNA-binding protein [Oscillospiraceae bacterium]